MKFAVVYFIGDTPQHDQLCGHYQTANTKMIYRHCNCPRAHGNNSRANVLKAPVSIKSGNMQVPNHKNGEEHQSVWLWKMSNFTAPTVEEGVNVEQYFKNVSHHCVHNGNTFYDLDFGENPHNIHLASPGERLHMHQLGCVKRAAETFREEFLGNNMWLLGEMDRIASYYGGAVQRQSDRDFPRTNFSESVHTAKKEGNQYIGMLCIQMLALLSAGGRQLLLSPRRTTNLENRSRKCEEEIDGYNKGVLNLDQMVVHFINCINNCLQQSKGEGNNLVKNHMYFHLSQYMRLFGPPTGWDSAASESNHKTEGGRSARSKFLISVRDGLPYMQWDKKKNASLPWFPSDVLTFCCNVVLPAAGTNTLCGPNGAQESDSGQLSNVWYDWANFQLDLLDGRGLQGYPCQILCLLHVEGPFPPGSSVSRLELVHDGYYTVGHCFLSVDPISSKRAEGRRDRQTLVKQGVLRNKLYLFDCNALESEVAVVRNLGRKDHYFVLGNMERWLFHFHDTMAGLEKK
eukprot:jgi/Psemu1/36697/gm1.36697_g